MSRLRAQGKKAESLEAVTVETQEVETVNPTTTLIDKVVATASTVEVAEIVEKKAGEPLVRINPNRDIRTYVGDQWYNLKAGKQVSVPKTVKDKLNNAGMLSPL